MQVTVLGCGNAWSRNLGHTSFLVENGDVKLVIDCGFLTPPAIERIIPLDKVTHYFISHIHADHTGGLEEVAFKDYFLYKQHKPTLLLPPDLFSTIWPNYLASGLRNLLTPDGSQDMIASLSTYFEPKHITVGTWVSIGCDLHLALYKTKHVGKKANYSLLVRNQAIEKQALFTCDVVVDNKLPYKSSDLIFHDCSFAPSYPATVHTHVEHLLALPVEIQQKTICCHYADEIAERGVLFEDDIEPLRLALPYHAFHLRAKASLV